MGKTKNTNTNKSSNPKKAKSSSLANKQPSGSGGLDEIDSLFAKKKRSDKETQQQISDEKERAKEERKRRKQARLEEEADEFALRGASSAAAAASAGGSASGSKKGDAVAPAHLHSAAQKLSSLTYTRADVDQLNTGKKEQKGKWATDGLGGVFNGEGFTGRRDDGGHRVFKAHLMNRESAGQTANCPFDCDCCFI